MIKGRYVALVEINFHVDEKECIRPFEDIKGDIANGYLTEVLAESIRDEFDEEFVDVKLTQQHADLYRVEEHDGITLQSIINKMPTIDAVEVVRCKNCKRFDPDTGLVGLGICEIYKGVTAEYGFCHHGKRKDGEL